MKYRRDDESNAYICDNLEEFLLEKGVSKEQINKAKSNIMKPNLLEFAVRESEEKPSEKLVPTEKIVGTLRATPGKSVFENVSVIYDGDRDEARFMNDLNKLNYWSLEEYKESFIRKIEPVDMVYYEDEDEYFMKGDGNHRTLTALLVGA